MAKHLLENPSAYASLSLTEVSLHPGRPGVKWKEAGPAINLPSQLRLVLILQLSEGVRRAARWDREGPG